VVFSASLFVLFLARGAFGGAEIVIDDGEEHVLDNTNTMPGDRIVVEGQGTSVTVENVVLASIIHRAPGGSITVLSGSLGELVVSTPFSFDEPSHGFVEGGEVATLRVSSPACLTIRGGIHGNILGSGDVALEGGSVLAAALQYTFASGHHFTMRGGEIRNTVAPIVVASGFAATIEIEGGMIDGPLQLGVADVVLRGTVFSEERGRYEGFDGLLFVQWLDGNQFLDTVSTGGALFLVPEPTSDLFAASAVAALGTLRLRKRHPHRATARTCSDACRMRQSRARRKKGKR